MSSVILKHFFLLFGPFSGLYFHADVAFSQIPFIKGVCELEKKKIWPATGCYPYLLLTVVKYQKT